MTTVITLFNHKGGVSKTTTVFNLGWMLAEKGHKTILVDADSQCNLTGMAMQLDRISRSSVEVDELSENSEEVIEQQDIEFSQANDRRAEFWDETAQDNLYSALRPAFYSEPKMLEPVKCQSIAGNDNLFLVPGSLNLGEYETSLGVAQSLSDTLSSTRNLPGAFNYLIRATAKSVGAEYVIVDLSPSLGAINQNIVSTSDIVLIPAMPDYYSHMALDSLSVILARWKKWAQDAHGREALSNSVYPFPEPKLKLGGVFLQRFKMYKGKPSSSFRRWIDKLSKKINGDFLTALKDNNLAFDSEVYKRAGLEESIVFSPIPDFNSLLPLAQELGKPVYALTDDEFPYTGSVLSNFIEQRDRLHKQFSDVADSVVELSEAV